MPRHVVSTDDLVKFQDSSATPCEPHRQSSHHMHQLTLAVSHVLYAMADVDVKDHDRERTSMNRSRRAFEN